jgi:hypothetical protein
VHRSHLGFAEERCNQEVATFPPVPATAALSQQESGGAMRQLEATAGCPAVIEGELDAVAATAYRGSVAASPNEQQPPQQTGGVHSVAAEGAALAGTIAATAPRGDAVSHIEQQLPQPQDGTAEAAATVSISDGTSIRNSRTYFPYSPRKEKKLRTGTSGGGGDFGVRFAQHLSGLQPCTKSAQCAACDTPIKYVVRCLTCVKFKGRNLCGECDALAHTGEVGVSVWAIFHC